MNKEERFLICVVCWRKSDHKNPPIVGLLEPAGAVKISRGNPKYTGSNLFIEGNFSILCLDCQTVLYERHEKTDPATGVIDFAFSGKILPGGTA